MHPSALFLLFLFLAELTNAQGHLDRLEGEKHFFEQAYEKPHTPFAVQKWDLSPANP